MAHYALVRGWLECEFAQVPSISTRVAAHVGAAREFGVSPEAARLYSTGWHFPDAPLNWTSLVFFGADVARAALPYVRAMLEQAAAVDHEISGQFFVDDEDGTSAARWVVAQGRVAEHARAPE